MGTTDQGLMSEAEEYQPDLLLRKSIDLNVLKWLGEQLEPTPVLP